MQEQRISPPNDIGSKLRIRQQNANKSLIAQTDLLHRTDPMLFDVVAIQEPYLDHFHNTRATQHWHTVYPREHFTDPGKTRSVILMNKTIVVDAWTQVELGSSDITAVQIQTRLGEVLMINTYNDNANTNSMRVVARHMRKMERECDVVANSCWPHLLWLGNFNSHHLLWDEPRNSHLFTRASLDRAQEIIEVIASYDLQMGLPRACQPCRPCRWAIS